uniref:Uncharacterized protein n=1 Tax=Anguilla anguilla TaxID=7936 RepID=A0A0E9X0X0_ANGAN
MNKMLNGIALNISLVVSTVPVFFIYFFVACLIPIKGHINSFLFQEKGSHFIFCEVKPPLHTLFDLFTVCVICLINHMQ